MNTLRRRERSKDDKHVGVGEDREDGQADLE